MLYYITLDIILLQYNTQFKVYFSTNSSKKYSVCQVNRCH
jgi:hypothetical protein